MGFLDFDKPALGFQKKPFLDFEVLSAQFGFDDFHYRSANLAWNQKSD